MPVGFALNPSKKGTSQKVVTVIGFKKKFPAGSFRTVLALFFFLIAAMSSGCASSGPIEFYRGPLNHLNAVRDGSCPMYPSCSAYAKTAFKKHGSLAGGVMTFDRLIRCGRDETGFAKEIYVNGSRRYHDPVHHNDFWWHENP